MFAKKPGMTVCGFVPVPCTVGPFQAMLTTTAPRQAFFLMAATTAVALATVATVLTQPQVSLN